MGKTLVDLAGITPLFCNSSQKYEKSRKRTIAGRPARRLLILVPSIAG